MQRRPRTVFLVLWSLFNLGSLAVVAWALVSLWPPPGASGDDYGGPGDGLLVLFCVVAPGLVVLLANASVLVWIVASAARRRERSLYGLWLGLVAAWVVTLTIVQLLEPARRRLGG